MLFNSFPFVVLVLVTFIFYYQVKSPRIQVYLLIIASLIFYAFSNYLLLGLLLISVYINAITSYYVVFGKKEFRRRYAVTGVTLNLLILVFFKYSPLFSVTFFNKNSGIGEFLLQIPLPVGISFYTFQGISLLVDVFREKIDDSKSLVKADFSDHFKQTLFFISFFPQLVAGPIVKAHDFIPQINYKAFKQIDWDYCFRFLVVGYFLKMVVADNLKDFTFWIEFPYFQGQSGVTLIVMLLGYSCQIFADFAGYSLIALGLAGLFGYQLALNFNFPYISSSFQEFWKRWHISLSSFLMEYLYIPLGGNRKGKLLTYRNLLLTMFLGGLWHGAAWSYAIWGLFHGLALAIERMLRGVVLVKNSIGVLFLKRTMVFLFVTFAWLLFKLPDFDHVIAYFESIGSNFYMPYNKQICVSILIYSSFIFVYHLSYLLKQKQRASFILDKNAYLLYGGMLFLILTNSGSSGSFIYFQF